MRQQSSAIHRSGESIGMALGFVGVAIFSLSLPATREAVEAFGAWTVGFGRAVLAAICAVAVLIATRTARPEASQLKRLMIVGAGVVVGFPLFTGLALETSTASRGAIVIGVLPSATALVATLRHGERPSRWFWLAAGGGLLTVVVFAVATGANGRPELADVFFLLAVLAAAIGYAEGAALTHELGGWQTISWALVIGLPITVPVATISLVHHGIDHPQLSHWVALGYVSLFSMYLGFFAWYAGLHLGGVARVSQIQLLQPTLTLLWSALLLGETVTSSSIATAALVLGFVAASKRAGVQRRPSHSAQALLDH
ncbi:MAG: DMT family transporter [Acidimicrobiales bacterium]